MKSEDYWKIGIVFLVIFGLYYLVSLVDFFSQVAQGTSGRLSVGGLGILAFVGYGFVKRKKWGNNLYFLFFGLTLLSPIVKLFIGEFLTEITSKGSFFFPQLQSTFGFVDIFLFVLALLALVVGWKARSYFSE